MVLEYKSGVIKMTSEPLVPFSPDTSGSVVEIISRGEEIIDYFASQNERCNALMNILPHAKFIAGGVYGGVYLFELEGTQYIVKKVVSERFNVVRYFHPPDRERMGFGEMADIFSNKRDYKRFDRNAFLHANGVKPTDFIEPGTHYYVPFLRPKVPCKLKKSHEIQKYYFVPSEVEIGRYNKVQTIESYTYPKGSYVCASSTYTEYIIASILSNEVAASGVENFLKILGFSMCATVSGGHELNTPHAQRVVKELYEGSPVFYDYTFMERVDGTIVDMKRAGIARESADLLIANVCVQVLFAMSFMQRKHIIQHNDLHLNNIGFLNVPTGSTRSPRSGKKEGPTHFSYTIDGETVVIPNLGYIAKILDFGLSAKYSSPVVANALTVDGRDRTIIPMWRDDSYDLIAFLYSVYAEFYTLSPLPACILAGLLDDSFDWTDLPLDAPKTNATFQSALKILNRQALYIRGQQPGRSTFAGVKKRAWNVFLELGKWISLHTKERAKSSTQTKKTKKTKNLGVLEGYHPEFFDRRYHATLHTFSQEAIRKFEDFTNIDRLQNVISGEIRRDTLQQKITQKISHQDLDALERLSAFALFSCINSSSPHIYNVIVDLLNLTFKLRHGKEKQVQDLVSRISLNTITKCMNCLIYRNLNREDVPRLAKMVSRLVILSPGLLSKSQKQLTEESATRIVLECIDEAEKRNV